jgi:hypothetical protein
MLNGETPRQGFRPNADVVVLQHLISLRYSQVPATVSVAYHDGAVLTFLFDRSTTIADLMTMVSRAGTVRKVML